MNPLYVITAVFNPRRFASRWRLYCDFAAWIKSCGVQLLTVEVTFGERPHAVTLANDPWHLQLVTRQEMWHKERAHRLGLNYLCEIAPGWDKVAWMDADVRLARPDWVAETVHLLQHYAILQMFGEARWLGPNHETLMSSRSCAKDFEEYGAFRWGTNPGLGDYHIGGHPGFAWAFRRDALENIGGWLDICVAGSADLHMAAGYMGAWHVGISPGVAPGYRAVMERHGVLCEAHIRRNVSYVPGAIDHYWHGRFKNRGYKDRWKTIDRYQFDPATDLFGDVQGLYRWNLDDPRVMGLAVDIRKSLAARNEDVNEL